MLVSIISVSFNSEATIERTIESVNIYYPQIVGDPGVVQYPINMSADVILSDYDTMVKQFDLQRDDK